MTHGPSVEEDYAMHGYARIRKFFTFSLRRTARKFAKTQIHTVELVYARQTFRFQKLIICNKL